MSDIEKLIERLFADLVIDKPGYDALMRAADAQARLVAPLPAEVAEEARYLRMLANATVPDLPHVTLPDSLRDIADMLESLALENARLAAMLTKSSEDNDAWIEMLEERDRLAAELAALSEAAMDADLHCWGPGFVSPEHAAPYAKALRLLCQPNADRSNAAWKLLDDLRRLAAENAELRGSDAAHEAKSLRQELTVAKAAHIRAVETAQQCYTELEVELKSHLRASQGEIDRLRAELETAKRGLTQLSQLGGGRSEGNLIAQETLARLDAMKGGV